MARLTFIREIVRRRRWVMLRAGIAMTLIAVIGSYLVAPTYEACCKILISRAKQDPVDLSSEGLVSPFAFDASSPKVDVAKVLAVSRPYIDKMVYRLQLRDQTGSLINADKLSEAGLASTIQRMLSPEPTISISRYEETGVLKIKAASADPEEAYMMANTLGEVIVDENRAHAQSTYETGRRFLEGQMDAVKQRYEAALGKLTAFKKQDKTIDLETETKLAAERMAQLLKEKEEGVIALAQARTRLGLLKQQLAKESPESLSASMLRENPHIGVLKKELAELRLQLAKATAEMTEKHPRVLSIKEQIDMAEAQLKKEIEICRSSAPELVQLERQIPLLDARLKEINASIDRSFKELSELPDKAFKQAGLDMELNAVPSAYSSLLDALCRIGMLEATALSQIRVIEPAVKPRAPVRPNKVQNGALGLLVGLVFGLGLVLVMEYRDDAIRTAEDVRKLRPIAFMGGVPRFRGEEVPLIAGRDPNDPLYESYRRILTHIDLIDHMGERPLRSLLITSPGPKEGKSTTAANLGICAAREGKRVATVDMDVRRASLHTYFGVPNEVGLSDVLQGSTSVDEAIQRTRVGGLSVIPSGLPFPDPGAMIESDKMGGLLSELETRFDLVILDSAPLLVKSDALVLARHVDGLVIVLESEKTTRRAVYEVADLLTKAQIRPLGFVLNRLSLKKGAYCYHQYYYGHYGRTSIGEAKDGLCLRAPMVGES